MLRVGTRFVLCSLGESVPDGLLPIRLVPNTLNVYKPWRAATRAVLEAMEDIDMTGSSVMDFGAGCGVLGIAAFRLGATSVSVIDYGEEAQELCRLNAEANNVLFDTIQSDDPGGDFDFILANVGEVDTLSDLAPRARKGLIGTGMSQRKLLSPRGKRPVYTRHIDVVDSNLIGRGFSTELVAIDSEFAVVKAVK